MRTTIQTYHPETIIKCTFISHYPQNFGKLDLYYIIQSKWKIAAEYNLRKEIRKSNKKKWFAWVRLGQLRVDWKKSLNDMGILPSGRLIFPRNFTSFKERKIRGKKSATSQCFHILSVSSAKLARLQYLGLATVAEGCWIEKANSTNRDLLESGE